MKNFQEEYKNKLTNIDEILSTIKSGDVLVTCGNACSPTTLLENLHKLKGKAKDVKLVPVAGIEGDYEFGRDPEMKDTLSIISTFYCSLEIGSHNFGNVSYVPVNLHDGQPRIFENYKVDKYFVTVCPMDKNGYFRFSLDNVSTLEWILSSKKSGKEVIFEVNPNMPRTFGEVEIHIDLVDKIYESNAPIFTIPDIPIGSVEMQIGKNVAELVKDGSTIQLGIGAIPNAVAKFLTHKNDLGVHTEMITNSMAELAQVGVINGRKKTLHWGKMVGNFALGNKDLYDYLDDNPSVMIMRGCYTNDPFVIAQNDNMTSINTALQVDLTGQVNSESIGSMQYSGTGGASDFAIGATHSKGGISIVAIKSTIKKGTISSIQPYLTPGSAVSIGRNNIDYIVTEYGIAKLKGLSIAQRAENLINICHPNFRDDLRSKAKDLKILF